eukprot:10364167-Karenia_brevis.AAC.1
MGRAMEGGHHHKFLARKWDFGIPLSRSTRGPFGVEPQDCEHPFTKVIGREGQSQSRWWTCLQCGA